MRIALISLPPICYIIYMPLFIIALFVPRLVALYLYFLTHWFAGVFETDLWPILGFIFMPYSMLWYSAVINWYSAEWGTLQIVVMVIAVIADFSSSKSVAK